MEGLLQPTHLIFVLGIVPLIFGPKKLPDLGHGLGKGIREFKDAVRGGVDVSQTSKSSTAEAPAGGPAFPIVAGSRCDLPPAESMIAD